MKRKLNIYRITALILVLALCAIILPAQIAQAFDYYVNPGGSIQDAINAANPGDTIHVAAGTYTELITLKDGVQVLGAGASITIISGNNSGTVVTASSVGSTTVLNGFSITSGNATYGGGMYNVDSLTRVTNCIFYGNFGSEGGGIYNDGSSPTITSCIFSGNSGSDGGGIGNADSSSPTVINCIFSGNTVTDYGGGMDNFHNCSPVVTNCSFSRNSAQFGGGMDNLENCSPILSNCIFWGDVPGEINNIDTSVPVVTYCDIQGGYAGNNIKVDPMFVNPANGNLHLQSGSPCIDTGTNTGAPSDDIDGNPRPIDGNGDSSAVTDMGAYEYQPRSQPHFVGGEVASVNKLDVLTPWIFLVCILGIGGALLVLKRRQTR